MFVVCVRKFDHRLGGVLRASQPAALLLTALPLLSAATAATLFFSYKNVGYKNIRLKFPIFYLIALRTSLHKTLRLNSFGDVLIKKISVMQAV